MCLCECVCVCACVYGRAVYVIFPMGTHARTSRLEGHLAPMVFARITDRESDR